MARTNSWAFPNLINPTQNRINIAEDNVSIVNRTRLLMLTEPTELYNNPTFGVGLKKYIFQYNNANVRALIQDDIKEKLRIFEPCVNADQTSFADGLLYTGGDDQSENPNHLKMTVGLKTIYGDDLSIKLNNDSDNRL